MISQASPFFFLVFVSFVSQIFSLTSPVFNGYQVVDLTGTTSSTFAIDSAPWALTGVSTTSTTTSCSSVPLLGGVGILNPSGYMKRTYKSLPTHNMIYFRLRFYVIDNWQSSDTFVIYFDTKGVSGGTPGSQKSGFLTNYCGSSSYNDLKYYTLVGKVLHSGSSLDLKITSGLSSAPSVASFGMREVSLQFVTKTSSDSEGVCSDVSDSGSNAVSMSNACSCSGAQYLETILLLIPACLSCNTACSSCFGSSASQCYSCKPTYSLINGACTKCATGCNTCNGTAANQCLTCSSGYWIRWDNTCVTTCDSPTYAQTVIDNLQICGVPCPSGQFWLWNQTCGSCPSPLIQGVTNFGNYCYKPCDSGFYYALWSSSCVSSCNSPLMKLNIYGIDGCKLPCENNDFLYPDGSCASNCDSPYLQTFDGLVKWCLYPCNFAGGESLLWDGTCVSSCLSPSYQHTENNIVYCDSCQFSGYYRYPNNTCILGCPSPWLQRKVNNSLFCDSPCNFAASQYLSYDGSCVSSCNSPSYHYTEDNIVYCESCQPGDYFRYPNNTCLLDCPSPRIQLTVNNSYFCDFLCDFAGGESLSWDGTCKNSCNSPSYLRTENNIVYCDACQPGYDLYPNNTCLQDCLSPRLEKTINGSYFCNDPCDFAGGEFLSWDGSCVNPCSSPAYQRTEDNIAYCDACQPGYNRYPNNTCKIDCISPRFQTSVNSSNFCNPPCDFSNGESLSWDGACVGSCLSPSYERTEDNIIYCDACQPDYFRYPNGTCRADCPSPWLQSTVNNSLFCNFPCDFSNGESLLWDGTCVSTCLAPSYQHTQDNIVYCDACQLSTDFRYPNDTCLPDCSLPWKQTSINSSHFCSYPCQTTEFGYWNGSCLGSCDSPYKKIPDGSYQYCYPPCGSSQFLYWDDFCQNSCDDPYKRTITDYYKLCDPPCDDLNDFYYENTSCLSACGDPYLQSTGSNSVKFCNKPCSENQYLFSDNSCQDSCNSPLIKSTIDNVDTCIQPCSSTSDFYYPSDKTCKSNCNSPNQKSTQNSVKICIIINPNDQLSDGEKEQVKNTNDAIQAGGSIAGAGASIAALVSSGNPGSALLVCFIKMLQYIKYMEINYPPRLLYMFQMQNDTIISLNFLPEGPDPFEKSLHKKPLPGKFDLYGGLDSHFLLNFWDSVWMISIVAVTTVLIMLLYLYFKKKQYHQVKNVFEQLTTIFKWNIMLILLCSTFDDIPLFTALELETLKIDSFSAFLSFAMCILMNFVVGYVLLKIIYIVRDLRRTKRTKIFHSHTNVGKYIVGLNKKWENYQVLYKAFKDDSFLQQIFLFIEMLRVYLFSLIIGFLYHFPILQATLILSFSLIMLVFAAKLKPFEEKIDQIQTIINELILLTVNICVFVLAILDHEQVENTKTRAQLGDTIIACNLIFNFTAVIFFAIQLITALREMYKLIKSKKPRTLKDWFKILLEVFQQDALTADDKQTKNEIIITNADPLRGNFRNLFNTTELNHHTDETLPVKSMLSPSKMNLLLTVEEDTSAFADNRISPVSLLKVPSGLEATSLINLATPSPDRKVAENLRKGNFSFRPSKAEFQEDIPSLNLLKNSSSSKLGSGSDDGSPQNNVTSLVIPMQMGLKTPKNKGRKGLASFRKSVNTIPEDLEKSQEKSVSFLQANIEDVPDGPFQVSFRRSLMSRIISPRSPLPDVEEIRLEDSPDNHNNNEVKSESEGSENSPYFPKDTIDVVIEGNEEDLEKEKNKEAENSRNQDFRAEEEKKFRDFMELASKKREKVMKKIRVLANPPKINLDLVDDKQQENE